MDKDNKDKRTSYGRFRFLSITWWIFHIALIFLIYFVITLI